MTYELAKELKDAGFPQPTIDASNRKGDWLIPDGIDDTMERLGAAIYAPTLSELIEACGERFSCLWKYPNDWEVLDPKTGENYKGSTPEEAVARLWIAINKK